MPELLNEHAPAGSMSGHPTLDDKRSSVHLRTCYRCGAEFETAAMSGYKCDSCKTVKIVNRPKPGGRFSGREKQIVMLILAGMSNKEIADVLHLTEGGIKVVISRIFDKADMQSRSQLMARRIAELEAALIQRESATVSSTGTARACSNQTGAEVFNART